MAEEKSADDLLNDDELDQVSGGGFSQTEGDANFLAKMGVEQFGEPDPVGGIIFSWGTWSKAVDGAWAKAGVTCCTVPFSGDNKYWIGGKQVSRKEAFAHVLRQKGYSEDAIASYNFDQWKGAF